MHDRKGQEGAEVQSEGLQQMQDLWQAEGIPQEIRNVQNMFQESVTAGLDPWSDKIELVEE